MQIPAGWCSIPEGVIKLLCSGHLARCVPPGWGWGRGFSSSILFCSYFPYIIMPRNDQQTCSKNLHTLRLLNSCSANLVNGAIHEQFLNGPTFHKILWVCLKNQSNKSIHLWGTVYRFWNFKMLQKPDPQMRGLNFSKLNNSSWYNSLARLTGFKAL